MIIFIIVSKFVCISHSLQIYIVLKIIVQKQINFTKQVISSKKCYCHGNVIVTKFYRRKNVITAKILSSQNYYLHKNFMATKMLSSRKCYRHKIIIFTKMLSSQKLLSSRKCYRHKIIFTKMLSSRAAVSSAISKHRGLGAHCATRCSGAPATGELNHHKPETPSNLPRQTCPHARFESMSFVVNILACKLKIVNNRNWKKK